MALTKQILTKLTPIITSSFESAVVDYHLYKLNMSCSLVTPFKVNL